MYIKCEKQNQYRYKQFDGTIIPKVIFSFIAMLRISKFGGVWLQTVPFIATCKVEIKTKEIFSSKCMYWNQR